MRVSEKVQAVLREWEGFAHAVQARRPDAGTQCEGWNARDVLIHNPGNADEFSRVLEAHMEGHPVDTRSFEEREGVYRAMTDVELWSAFVARCRGSSMPPMPPNRRCPLRPRPPGPAGQPHRTSSLSTCAKRWCCTAGT